MYICICVCKAVCGRYRELYWIAMAVVTYVVPLYHARHVFFPFTKQEHLHCMIT